MVRAFAPTSILTWDWKTDNNDTRVTTNLGYTYSFYSGTSLGWNGNAYDPRPDYYKNFPSAVGNVWGSDGTRSSSNEHNVADEDFLLKQWETLANIGRPTRPTGKSTGINSTLSTVATNKRAEKRSTIWNVATTIKACGR